MTFVDGKVIVWAKGSSIENARTIGICEGRLHILINPPPQALMHLDINPFELWHIMYGHLHYKIFPSLNQMVASIPQLKEEHEAICKGTSLCKNVKKHFTSSDTRSKEIFDLIHFDVCGPMS